MRAARLHQYKRPRQLEEVDLPKPKGEAVVNPYRLRDVTKAIENLESGKIYCRAILVP